MSDYDYPVKPFAAPKLALQAMGEALDCQAEHEHWHRTHPGEPCPPEMFSFDSYEQISRGASLLDFGGGGTIEPGDSFAAPRRKE